MQYDLRHDQARTVQIADCIPVIHQKRWESLSLYRKQGPVVGLKQGGLTTMAHTAGCRIMRPHGVAAPRVFCSRL